MLKRAGRQVSVAVRYHALKNKSRRGGDNVRKTKILVGTFTVFIGIVLFCIPDKQLLVNMGPLSFLYHEMGFDILGYSFFFGGLGYVVGNIKKWKIMSIVSGAWITCINAFQTFINFHYFLVNIHGGHSPVTTMWVYTLGVTTLMIMLGGNTDEC